MSALIDPVGIDLARLLHGGEEYEYFGSIHPGDVLTIYTRVADIYEREKKGKPGKSMEFTVFESEMKNQKGELVVKSRTIFIER